MQGSLCARPGCAGSATAWLTYDYAAQRVWLDDGPDAEAGNQWGLCAAHAGRLRVPIGWTTADRRARSGRKGGKEPPTPLVS